MKSGEPADKSAALPNLLVTPPVASASTEPRAEENCKDFSNVSIQKWSGRTFVSTPGGPKAPGREPDFRFCVPAAIRVPVPFRGSANGERVPRTFGNLLFVEALGPYSCGLIERRRADTLAVGAGKRCRQP